jgi:hypothetical protein
MEEQNTNFINFQSNQLIEEALNQKYSLDKEELLKMSLPSFQKTSEQKEKKDIILIALYLIQMHKFLEMFGDNVSKKKDNTFYEQIKEISRTILYQKYNKNRLVVRYGEKGTKFFLILKGEVQIVLPNKIIVHISLKEFKRYLLLLYIYKEYEILRIVIKENKVNQRKGLFNASNIFFPEENIISLNNNNNNKGSNTNKAHRNTLSKITFNESKNNKDKELNRINKINIIIINNFLLYMLN